LWRADGDQARWDHSKRWEKKLLSRKKLEDASGPGLSVPEEKPSGEQTLTGSLKSGTYQEVRRGPFNPAKGNLRKEERGGETTELKD